MRCWIRPLFVVGLLALSGCGHDSLAIQTGEVRPAARPTASQSDLITAPVETEARIRAWVNERLEVVVELPGGGLVASEPLPVESADLVDIDGFRDLDHDGTPEVFTSYAAGAANTMLVIHRLIGNELVVVSEGFVGAALRWGHGLDCADADGDGDHDLTWTSLTQNDDDTWATTRTTELLANGVVVDTVEESLDLTPAEADAIERGHSCDR